MSLLQLREHLKTVFVCLTFLLAANVYSQEGTLSVDTEPVRIAGGDGEFFMAPKFSPDGEKLAFTQPRYNGLWVMNLADETIQQITDAPSAGFGFSWSEDSGAILARVSRYEEQYRYTAIKIFDVQDHSETIVADYQRNIIGVPQWSDTGENVIINTREGIEVQSSPRQMDTIIDEENQEQIQVFSVARSIGVRDAVTTDIQSLQPLGDQNYINITLSPDKSRIAFEIVGGNLHAMNVDGSNVIDLGRGHRPQWSPDGEYIVFMVTEDDGHEYTASDIYAVRPGGTGRTRLTDDVNRLFMNPSWSPDGERIVFNDMTDGSIYFIEVSY